MDFLPSFGDYSSMDVCHDGLESAKNPRTYAELKPMSRERQKQYINMLLIFLIKKWIESKVFFPKYMSIL